MRLLRVALLAASAWSSACSSVTTTPSDVVQSCPVAAAGPADTHCGAVAQRVEHQRCHPGPTAGDEPRPNGAPMYGEDGADDDCKYFLTWTADDACPGGDATFQLTATFAATGAPVRDAHPTIEAYLERDATH